MRFDSSGPMPGTRGADTGDRLQRLASAALRDRRYNGKENRRLPQALGNSCITGVHVGCTST